LICMNNAMSYSSTQPNLKKKQQWATPLVYDILLLYILVFGLFFRFNGILWGDFQYLHPDERFLVWVGTDIQPIRTPSQALGPPPNAINNPYRATFGNAYPDCQAWGGYFDASCSPLNPNNRGHSFYVYGTLPMFLTRYVVQWIYGHSGFNEMTVVGRVLSASIDLLSVILVYAIGSRVFKKSVGLLAAAFSAFTVLNIQQSHFFTMDTFSNFFTLLAVYFAIRIYLVERETKTGLLNGSENPNSPSSEVETGSPPQTFISRITTIIKQPYLGLSIAFGIALGCAVASKLNSAPVAFVLPVALGLVIWKKPAHERTQWMINGVIYLGIAAFVSILVFRVFQPYAFYGPGFFGVRPNPQWVANIKELFNQTAGDIDYPPSLQWARRPVWFSAQNIVDWGLGIPLGILAFVGFLWAGWRMLKGDWQHHILLWVWGGFYFVWQSLQFNPTMRYQMPTYPILVIYAGWAAVELWNFQKRKKDQGIAETSHSRLPTSGWTRLISILVGSVVLITTFMWALGFSQIYSRPITRLAASEWIYQNIPGPINLHIQGNNGSYNQPVSIPYGSTIRPGLPYQSTFTANASGTLKDVYLAHVIDLQASLPIALNISLSTSSDGGGSIMEAVTTASPTTTDDTSSNGYLLKFDTPVNVEAGQVYYLTLALTSRELVLNTCGPVGIIVQTPTALMTQTMATPEHCVVSLDTPVIATIIPQESGLMEAVVLNQLDDQIPASGPQTLVLTIGPAGDNQMVATAYLTADLTQGADSGGAGYTMLLDHPVILEQGKNYSLSLALESGNSVVSVRGSAVANEGDWDDGLPYRLDGYDPFGGIYTPGLNFNMYWDDNPEKLERFISIYDQTEYILISSNRQWGSLPRLPERFPMSTLHYRHLLGCPATRTIQWCYSVAQPGMFHGDLGFELVEIFQSDPVIGPLSINDQFAEEAFTVYDHPKVLVFRKTEAYTAEYARQILSQANFSEIVRITPKKAAFHPANLKFPDVRLAVQTVGGTWSELFDSQAWQNRFQVLGVIVWYISVSLLGLLVYPLLRVTLPGLPDHGYPLVRTAGMLILAYLTWLAGSVNIPFNRLTISMVLLVMAAGGGYLAYRQRDELRMEWKSKRKYFLIVEGLVLAFFLIFLFIRLGNPDLWHPWKGGEKPMDFSYFNAVLKSTTFPPYDPWYAGGYLNYYYWGYVFVGVLVKWLGIVPSFAYNLIIPTLFSMVTMGAFSIGYNLSHPRNKEDEPPNTVDEDQSPPTSVWKPYLIGLASALGLSVLGNLGTLRMIVKGWEQLGVSGGLTESTGFFTRLMGLPVGLYQTLFQGATMPYSLGDWYWIPSRAFPAPGDVEPITEFPIFTFLYGDLHAHMIALAIAMLALTWVVAVLMGKARWKNVGAGAMSILIGGLAIGALYPTNLSDIYTYLPIGMLVFGYTIFRYAEIGRFSWFSQVKSTIKRLILAVLGMLLLAVVSYVLYLPYRLWYAQGYSSVIPWFGTHTPFWSYLTHWGLFLFVIVSWMVWETRQWMAETPLRTLRKLEKFTGLFMLVLVSLFLICLLLSIKIPGIENISLLSKLPLGRGAALVWFILPLATWAGVLLLRPGMPDVKRLVLFWVGTGLLITLMVEVVVVQGDIGRMNTVFKFYLHSWVLFALSATAALGWLLEPVRRWLPGWRISWRVAFSFLIFSAALFTLYGSMAKIKDRWVPTAPHTLDGLAYMPFATYYESYPGESGSTPVEQRGLTMDLSQDYRAIRWMQENIQGSPVIVEANSRNLYRWYSRYTINTGLPGVVGWEWHEQQQRAVNPSDWVTKRITDINQFYTTVNTDITKQFLNLYGVRYIVVGQLEQVTYPGPGLDKFPAFNGVLWNEVYRDANTAIYEVIK
jgi:YYY domain-containing protein